MPRLLHISDLHRSPSDPVGNAELISTLVADHDRQRRELTPIGNYDAAIVSGDIIQGVPLGLTDAHSELRRQYDAAYQFLTELADRFFEGDRAKIVIVPGNHDVDWNAARNSMEVVDNPTLPVRTLLTTPNSPFRWNWASRELYKIRDRALYETRFNRYRDFHRRFYDGVNAPTHSDADGYFDLFELCNDRIIVAAFNSCHENDCYRDEGAIPEQAIARAHLAIRDCGKQYSLKLAVWHHSIEGPPGLSDYMDVSLVRRMIDRGFRLGLHGHQHRAEAATHHINLPERTDMVVISAGSLCAGPRDLPVGMQRQYNVIEISNEFDSCRLHVREVTSANVFVPSIRQFAGASFIDIKWTPELDDMGQIIDMADRNLTGTVLTAEKLAREGDPDGAFSLLRPYYKDLSAYGRQLLIDSAITAARWPDILLVVDPSKSHDELVSFVEAAIRMRKFDLAQSTLEREAITVGLGKAHHQELTARINAKRTIGNG
jgi:hypothetical protein